MENNIYRLNEKINGDDQVDIIDYTNKLADSIQKKIDDIIMSGDTNAEVVDARGEFNTLGKRLDNLDTKKVDKEEGKGLSSKDNQVVVSSETPTTGEKVWLDKTNNTIKTLNENGEYEDFNTNVYSTTELKTNKKWANGKPIYRKIVEGTFGTNNVWGKASLGIENLEIIGTYELYFRNSLGLLYKTPFYESANFFVSLALGDVVSSEPNNIIYLQNGFEGCNYSIIVEYTKTTD